MEKPMIAITQVDKSELGKKIREIATSHGLTATAKQHSPMMITQGREFTRVNMQLVVNGNDRKKLTFKEQEKRFRVGTRAFIKEISAHVNNLNEAKHTIFQGDGTNGKVMDGHKPADLVTHEEFANPKSDKAFKNTVTLMTFREQHIAWIEFRIYHE
jgi:hypothetical protein